MARIYVDRVKAEASEGARLLWGVVQRLGSQSELARRLDVPKSCINRWLRGEQKPDTTNRLRLARYGVPQLAWDKILTAPHTLPAHGTDHAA